jgi:hypothetical protein
MGLILSEKAPRESETASNLSQSRNGTPYRHPKGALTHMWNDPGCKIFL